MIDASLSWFFLGKPSWLRFNSIPEKTRFSILSRGPKIGVHFSITGRIFVDGVEVYTQFIDNLDGVGVKSVITANVAVGSFIDFAIDPTGSSPSGQPPFSARADGSHFSAEISTTNAVPEPTSFAVLGTGCLVLLGWFGFRKRELAA
jgi:hypothetical protein